MFVHVFRLDSAGYRLCYIYILTKVDGDTHKPFSLIKSYRKFMAKKWDIVYNYDFIGTVEVTEFSSGKLVKDGIENLIDIDVVERFRGFV
jgi:hypothetical protein